MTCEPARDEYIEAVADAVEAAKCLTSFAEQYLQQVKSRPVSDLHTDEWRVYTECLNRLVREQRAAHVRYKDSSKRHTEHRPLGAKSA
jgi:IS1 family transposase